MAGLSKGETKGSAKRSARSCHLLEVSPEEAAIFKRERAGDLTLVQAGLRNAEQGKGAERKQLAWDARTERATTRRMSLILAERERSKRPTNSNSEVAVSRLLTTSGQIGNFYASARSFLY